MERERDSVRVAAACAVLRHPVTLAALGLLLLNDHLLKGRWPSGVTGKLSDLVWGPVAVPLVALVIAPVAGRLGRRGWASVATVLSAVPFVAVNLSSEAAGVAERVLSAAVGPSTVTTDPTDLLLLPALVVSWHLLTTHRASERPARPPASRTLTVIVLGVALFGTTATSCFDGRPRVAQLGTGDRGHLLAVVELGEDGGRALHASTDGHTWTLVDEVPYGGTSEPASQRAIERVVTASERAGLERCAGDTCYRLDPDAEELVRTSGGTTDRIALADPRRHLARQRALQGPVCAGPDSAPRPRDLELVPTAAGEPRVVVSRGLEGITAVDGDRTRDLALAGAGPVDGGPPRLVVIGPELVLLAAATTLTWLIGSATWWNRLAHEARASGDRRGTRRWAAWLAVLLAAGAAFLTGLFGTLVGDESVGALAACAVLGAGIAAGWLAFGVPPDRRQLPLRLAGRAAAPAAGMAVIVAAWGAALVPSYTSMVLTAAVVAVAVAELTRRRLPLTSGRGRAGGPGPPAAGASG